MQTVKALSSYLDNLLQINGLPDFSNNGLQVEASKEIRTMAFGVDASLSTIRKAISAHADLLFVHHGISWGNGIKYFTQGHSGEILSELFCNHLSLYGCHLPLDKHPVLGNNAIMAQFFDTSEVHPCFDYHGTPLGLAATLSIPISLQAIAAILETELGLQTGQARIFPFGAIASVTQIGILSGSGGNSMQECYEQGIDVLITGELSHPHAVEADNLGISVITAGHYTTETTGPRAVMAHISKTFPDTACIFIDAPTGL